MIPAAAAAGARSIAAHAVARVLGEGVTLDSALQDALAGAPGALVPPVRSLGYGAVRGYFRHEAILGMLLSQPVRSLDRLVRAILSVALFELEDARTPAYAVVDAAVKTAKATDAARASGLINAVLRRYLRERAGIDAGIERNPPGTPPWRNTSPPSAPPASAPAPSRGCRARWCSTCPATCRSCRGSPKDWYRCRISVRSASHSRWTSGPDCGCSTPAPLPAARPP